MGRQNKARSGMTRRDRLYNKNKQKVKSLGNKNTKKPASRQEKRELKYKELESQKIQPNLSKSEIITLLSLHLERLDKDFDPALFIEDIHKKVFNTRIWENGFGSDKRGLLSEYYVLLDLNIIKKDNPKIEDVIVTERGSRADRDGIDVIVRHVDESGQKVVNIQIKSSSKGQLDHKISDKGKYISSVVSSIHLGILFKKLKEIIDAKINRNEIIHI